MPVVCLRQLRRALAKGRRSPYTPSASRVERRLESQARVRQSVNRNRVLAFFVFVALSLQLGLAGAGVTCLAPSGAAAASQAGDEMVAMSGMGMTGPSERTVKTGMDAPAPGEQGPGSIPCERVPVSTSCQLFASCAAGFVVADSRAAYTVQVTSSSLRVIELITPPSRTVAPELPPPRA